MNKIELSVVIPCLNEENYISDCIDSILMGKFDLAKLEIIVCDGGSTDKTLLLLEGFKSRCNLKIIHNEFQKTPFAMNLGIKNSIGDYIAIVGAHSKLPSNYFSDLIKSLHNLKADNVGGVLETCVKSDNKLSNSIAAVLSDKLGVGNSTFRTGAIEPTQVDTVPFGLYKKEIFNEFGYLDTRLVRGQDLEFNKRLITAGKKIVLIPEIKLKYYCKESLTGIFKHYFRTGYWVINLPILTSKLTSVGVRHITPLFFSVGFIANLLFLFSGYKYLLPFYLIYLMIISVRSFQINNEKRSIVLLILTFFCLHFSYGLGSLYAVNEFFFKCLIGLLSRLIACLIFILALPILILVSLIIKFTSKGPVIHWSKRVGKNNKIFLMPKFRSMYIDTPDVATHLLNNSESFITPIGKVIRKTSIDELPQLLSIIKGDMNFVGPRPALFNQDDLIELRKFYSVDKIKPGVTGWAQINGRDEIEIPLKVKLDTEYLIKRSFFFNIKIIFLTFYNVLLKKGIKH
tara:strand:- start:121805 stop:123346 length:1542 start_codon:yes stop_codon:yes gene_type:complete